jgi:hypothetical protein
MPPVAAVRLAGFDPPFEVKDMRFDVLRLSVIIFGAERHGASIRGPGNPSAAFAIGLRQGIPMMRRQLTQALNPRSDVETKRRRHEMFHERLNGSTWYALFPVRPHASIADQTSVK